MSQLGVLFSGLWGADPGAGWVDEQGGKAQVFGTRPDVAPYTPTILSDETAKATAANLENYPGITELLNKLVPGFTDILAQGTANTLSELKGEIPADVAAQVQRSSAFQSLAGGYSGTPMAKALTARDLGLTSLNLTQMGNNSAQAWTQIAENAYSPWTVSTSEQAAATAANNAGAQAQKQYEFNVAASPDPGAAGVFNLDAAIGQQWMSFGMASMGGAGGGGSNGSFQVAPQQTQQNTMYSPTNSGGYTYDPSVGRYVPYNSGGQWQNNASGAWSDRRLKEEILFVGQSPSGFNIYEFQYKGYEGPAVIRWRGVMAQEVMEQMPCAVCSADGFLKVDYDMLDTELERVS